MNHLWVLEKENADERQSPYCLYCAKVLKSYHALGGHLRAHQGEIKSWRNLVGSNDLSNVTDTTSINRNLLSKRQRRKASPEYDTEYARGPYALHPSILSGSGLTRAQRLNFFHPPGFSPSENNLITGSPVDLLSSLCPNGCQFNTDESRTLSDMLIPGSEASIYPSYKFNRLPYSGNAQSSSDPSLVSSHLLECNGPTTDSSLRPGDWIGSSQANAYTEYARGPYALHPSILSGSGLTRAQRLNFFHPPGFSPSENNLITGSPVDLLSSLCPNGCQFNTDESRTLSDMLIPGSESSIYPSYKFNRLPYSGNAQSSSDPSLVSSHLLECNGPTTDSSLRPGDWIGSSQANAYTEYARGPYALHPSILSGSGLTRAQRLNSFRPPGFSPSENNLITGSPVDLLSSLCPNGCQFNTDESRTLRDMSIPGFEVSSYPCYKFNRLPYSGSAQTSSDPSLVSRHLLQRNEPTPDRSLQPGDGIGSSRSNADRTCRDMVLNSDRGENHFFRGIPWNLKLLAAGKRKIDFNCPVKNELLLFKDVENSLSGMGIPPDVEREDQIDLDLSLRLYV